jgi:hypothetical protein
MAAVRLAFAPAVVAWALALPLATFAASRPHASAAGAAFVVVVYSIGSLICHQLPARSYHLWAMQMPVCARCTGIYFGAAVSVIVAAAFRHGARGLQPSVHRSPERLALRRLAPRHPRVSLALAVAPTLLTLLYEWTTGDMPSHAIRAAAGVPIGAVVAWLVVAAADNRVN